MTHCRLPLTTQAHAYIEYNNELYALMPSSISTCFSFPSVVSLYVLVNIDLFLNKCVSGYLEALRVTEDGSTARKPRTQLRVLSRHVVVDGTVSTYFLLYSGVSPSFKGDEAV
jgi:hypothetical protein